MLEQRHYKNEFRKNVGNETIAFVKIHGILVERKIAKAQSYKKYKEYHYNCIILFT